MVLLKTQNWRILIEKKDLALVEESKKKLWFKIYKPDIFKFIEEETAISVQDNFWLLKNKFEELAFKGKKIVSIESAKSWYEDQLRDSAVLTKKAIQAKAEVIKNPVFLIKIWSKYEYVLRLHYMEFDTEKGKYNIISLSPNTTSAQKIIDGKQFSEKNWLEDWNNSVFSTYKLAKGNTVLEKIKNVLGCVKHPKEYLSDIMSGKTTFPTDAKIIFPISKYLHEGTKSFFYNLYLTKKIDSDIINLINLDYAYWYYLNSIFSETESGKELGLFHYFRPQFFFTIRTNWIEEYQKQKDNPSIQKALYNLVYSLNKHFYENIETYFTETNEVLAPTLAYYNIYERTNESWVEYLISNIQSIIDCDTEEKMNKSFPFVIEVEERDELDRVYETYVITDTYLNYYGKEAEEGHITKIPRMWRSEAVAKLLLKWITKIDMLSEQDLVEYFGADYPKREYGKYILKYLEKKDYSIDVDLVKYFMNSFKWKTLYFYDYETISSAFPLYKGYGMFQNIVAQYSCHALTPSGKVLHSQYLLGQEETNNLNIIRNLFKFVSSVTPFSNIKSADEVNFKFVVWNATFEITRNKEMIKFLENIWYKNKFAEYWTNEKEIKAFISFLNLVNINTIDLADLFSKRIIFFKDLDGKWSLKNVFPKYSKKYSYDNLNIKKGDVAATKIFDMLSKKIIDKEAIEKIRADLFEYCGLDTKSMVLIYQAIQNELWNKINIDI